MPVLAEGTSLFEINCVFVNFGLTHNLCKNFAPNRERMAENGGIENDTNR